MFVATGLLLVTLATDGSVLEVCASPMPTCLAPAPATVDARQYQKFLGIDWVPTIVEPCAAPTATCIGAAPRATVLTSHGLRWQSSNTPACSTQEYLQRWEEATAEHSTWTTAEKQWLARHHQPWLSAVALEQVARLSSSVQAASLTREFDWTVVGQREADTVLKAVPKDETVKLFCPELRVTLSTGEQMVQAIEVADRNGELRGIELPWTIPAEQHDKVYLVRHFEISFHDSDTPQPVDLPPRPSRSTPIRFAVDVDARPIR